MPLTFCTFEICDEELIIAAKNNSQDAFENLLRKYKSLIYNICEGYFIQGADYEDLKQEALMGFYKAIRDFEGKFDVSFINFASMCIRRQVITAVRTANRQKQCALNFAYSLNKISDQDNQRPLWELIPDLAIDSPEEIFLFRESVRESLKYLAFQLTDFEYCVLKLKLCGLDHSSAAQKMGVSYRGILNAMYRIRKKLRTLSVSQKSDIEMWLIS